MIARKTDPEPPVETRREPAGDVAKAVRESLEWDTRVPPQRVRWSVAHGVVTLDGVLDSWREREDAEQAVRGVCGVEGVVNRIAVRPPPSLGRFGRARLASVARPYLC